MANANVAVIDLPGEVWREITWANLKYRSFVSNLGRVKSETWRRSKDPKGKLIIKLRAFRRMRGYLKARLINAEEREKYFPVHRLVARAFIDLVEGKNDVNHIDADRTNNRVENLEWCTPVENLKDRWKRFENKNVTISGEGHYGAKLNNEIVREIREVYSRGGISQGKMARIYGIEQSGISCIIRRKTWKYVD